MRLLANHGQLRALKRRKRHGLRKTAMGTLRWVRPKPLSRYARRVSRAFHRNLWEGFEAAGYRCNHLEINGIQVDVEAHRRKIGVA